MLGLLLKLVAKPGFVKPRFGIREPMAVVSVLGVFWIWMDVMGSCVGSSRVRKGADGGCGWDWNWNCVKSLCSAVFLVVLVGVTLVGVDWDAGLVEWLMALGEGKGVDAEKGESSGGE
jgi:hypothetical protein